MNIYLKYFIGLCSLLFAINIYSQTVADSLILPELVVTKRANDSEIRSTSPIQVLSSKTIQNMQALNVSDAVKHFSGVIVKDYGGIGGLKTISVRSLGANHTVINYNGIAVSDVQSGQIDIGRFSLDNVENISLVSGQSDQIFVTAREASSASALNIITVRPSFEDGKRINGKVAIKGGSFGLINPSFNTNIKLSNKISANINGEWLSSNGEYPYRLYYGKEGVDSSSVERRQNTDVENIRLEGAFYANFSDNTKGDIRFYYYNSKRGLPGATIYYNTDNFSKQRLWDETFFTQGSFEHSFYRKWVVKANAKYNHGYLRYLDPTALNSAGKVEDIFNQSEMYGSASVLYRASNTLSFSAATDLSSATMTSNKKNFAVPTRLLSQSALSAKWINEYAIATASLIYTQTHESVKNGTPSDNHRKLSPYISISAKPFTSSDFRIRAFYKNSFRLPTFNDIYYPNMGVKDLKPEDATQYNLGVTYSKSFDSVVSLLKVTVDAYHNNIINKIVAYPTSNIHKWSMSNYDRVVINGLDANIEIAFDINKKAALILSSAYTYQISLNKTDPDNPSYNHQLPYTPKHSGSTRALLDNKWVNVAYTFLWSGGRYYNAYNAPEYLLDGYFDHGVTLSKDIKTNIGLFSLSIEGINLSNKNYQIVRNYPMPGRSYRANIIFNF